MQAPPAPHKAAYSCNPCGESLLQLQPVAEWRARIGRAVRRDRECCRGRTSVGGGLAVPAGLAFPRLESLERLRTRSAISSSEAGMSWDLGPSSVPCSFYHNLPRLSPQNLYRILRNFEGGPRGEREQHFAHLVQPDLAKLAEIAARAVDRREVVGRADLRRNPRGANICGRES